MGKIILEFDSVEEAQEAKDALNVSSYIAVLFQLDQTFRSTIKYGSSILKEGTEATSEEIEIAEKYREELHNLLREVNLSLD